MAKAKKKKRTSQTFPKTARGMLGLIDRFLARNGLESEYLWNVLSAIRGPDDEDGSVKACSTSVIRAKAFPRTHGLGMRYGTSYSDCEPFAAARKSGDCFGSSHFRSHAIAAFHALRLKWNETNK